MGNLDVYAARGSVGRARARHCEYVVCGRFEPYRRGVHADGGIYVIIVRGGICRIIRKLDRNGRIVAAVANDRISYGFCRIFVDVDARFRRLLGSELRVRGNDFAVRSLVKVNGQTFRIAKFRIYRLIAHAHELPEQILVRTEIDRLSRDIYVEHVDFAVRRRYAYFVRSRVAHSVYCLNDAVGVGEFRYRNVHARKNGIARRGKQRVKFVGRIAYAFVEHDVVARDEYVFTVLFARRVQLDLVAAIGRSEKFVHLRHLYGVARAARIGIPNKRAGARRADIRKALVRHPFPIIVEHVIVLSAVKPRHAVKHRAEIIVAYFDGIRKVGNAERYRELFVLRGVLRKHVDFGVKRVLAHRFDGGAALEINVAETRAVAERRLTYIGKAARKRDFGKRRTFAERSRAQRRKAFGQFDFGDARACERPIANAV